MWFPGSDFLITQIFPPHRDVWLGNTQGKDPSCPQLNVVQRLGARGKFTVTFQPQPDLNAEDKQIFSLEFPSQGLSPHNPPNLSVFLGQSQKRTLRHLHSLMSKVLPVKITCPLPGVPWSTGLGLYCTIHGSRYQHSEGLHHPTWAGRDWRSGWS